MAPEQIRGQDCDGRTDLFSLGVMFYEMLAGARPFTGATMADVMAAILTAEPNPFPAGVASRPGSRRSFAARWPKTPGGPLCIGQGVRCRARRGWKRACRAATRVRPAAQTSVAVLPFVDLSPHRDHEYFCDGMAEEILNALARLPGLRVASASRSFRFRGRDIDAQSVGGGARRAVGARRQRPIGGAAVARGRPPRRCGRRPRRSGPSSSIAIWPTCLPCRTRSRDGGDRAEAPADRHVFPRRWCGRSRTSRRPMPST